MREIYVERGGSVYVHFSTDEFADPLSTAILYRTSTSAQIEALTIVDPPSPMNAKLRYVFIDVGALGLIEDDYMIIWSSTGNAEMRVDALRVRPPNSDRLVRLEGIAGKNALHDLHTFDAAGNLLSYRVRLFDSQVNAEAATIDSPTPEAGEHSVFVVTQTFDVSRSTRTSLRTSLDSTTLEE